MYTTIKQSLSNDRIISLSSSHPRNAPRPRVSRSMPSKRFQSTYGTKSYNDALQRAFNKAKEQIFFNPDMKYFITLTYRGKSHTPEDVLHDVKMLIKRESRRRRDRAQRRQKYIFVMEYQKRGSIHVHMIANDFFSLNVNKNGFRELKLWDKGFSSVLRIDDFDLNFKPYLYLFKYMRKAQRIGRSFVHTSRGLGDSYRTLSPDEFIDVQAIKKSSLSVTSETTTCDFVAGEKQKKLFFFKNYVTYDTLKLQKISQKGHQPWQQNQPQLTHPHQFLEEVRLHSQKELAKIRANRIPPLD